VSRIIVVSTVAFFCGLLGFWVTDRDLPVVTEHYEVLGDVQPGADLLIKFTVNRRKDCYAMVVRSLYDSTGARDVTQRDVPSVLGPPGRETFTSRIAIPRTFAAGEGKLRIARSYYCNPLHLLRWPVSELIPDIEFKIGGEPVPAAPVEVIPR
jgi:hypothetical protein